MHSYNNEQNFVSLVLWPRQPVRVYHYKIDRLTDGILVLVIKKTGYKLLKVSI